MAFRRYTRDELLRLRESPLVQKPENLPAIEQWIEYVYVDKDSREKLRIPHSEQQQPSQNATLRRQPQAKTGGDGSPMGNFSTGLRPSLMSTRNAASRSEDVSLGPPKTMFPSSRNVSKLSDFTEKNAATTNDAAAGEEQEAPRSRFFGDRSNRKSTQEKEGKDNRDSWTSAREKKALGGDDEQRHEGRYNRRDREHDGERRNGHGEKHDNRWGGRDDRRQNGDRQGGWREREREKKDRDWDRGAAAEKEPEWMEDPAPAGAEDDLRTMGMPRNQEQFQKWKEAMSGKKAQIEEAAAPIIEPAQPTRDVAPQKPFAPLQLEGIVDKSFAGWTNTKSANTPESAPTPAKSAPGKTKGSRFASVFAESQAKEESPPAEPTESKPANGGANGSAEDVAGFNRILQMLGNNTISQPAPQEGPASPLSRTNTNGTKQKSRFTGFFDQAAKSPERIQSPPDAPFRPSNGDAYPSNRGFSEDLGQTLGGRLQEMESNGQTTNRQPPSNPVPQEPLQNRFVDKRQQQPDNQRMNDIFLDQPPSRGAATPDLNIQNLLASQRAQRPQGQDNKNSEFLLNLLQTKTSRPSSQQARPDNNFPLWLDQPQNTPEPHAPKPRNAPPPPGLFEDQLLRNAPPELPRQEQQSMPDIQQRRPSQRAPPGFYDEQSLFMQQQQQAAQRRNFTEPPQQHPGRRMSGHPNLPQMQIPQSHQQFAGLPPEFLQSPGSGHPQAAPPPGFNPHMRHPPGFNNIPNIFHQQQGREPPGFQGGMPASAGGMQSPPNAPPGFFGGPQGMPPGFMQMRSPSEAIPAGAGQLRGNGRGYDGAYDGSGMGQRR